MVVAESKPVSEILEMIKDCKKVVVAGCKGCVTVCNSGGEKEVGFWPRSSDWPARPPAMTWR
jgi:hypothetical protein